MNTARILSIAAVAAFASIGAQAAESNSGDVYGTDFEARTQSTRARTEVRAEGKKTKPESGQGTVADPAARTKSTLERPAVRKEAATANRAHQISTGENN